MGSSTTASSTAASTCYIPVYFVMSLFIIHPNDLGLFLFQRRDIKLQIDTKVNVLGIVEVLKKL